MIYDINIRIEPCNASNEKRLKQAVSRAIGIKADEINEIRIVRRSVDARKRNVVLNLGLKVAAKETKTIQPEFQKTEFRKLPGNATELIIVGAGPAGLFAALRALESGVRPVVIERGKDVDSRRNDLAAISRHGVVDEDSNYCFGEGGAGAFSDGKLFTRSKKRGNVRGVLELLYQFGASENVLIDSHPHIGSDRLPKIIKSIRECIIENGGRFIFENRVTDIVLDERQKCVGVLLADGRRLDGEVVLATGHSARDVYEFLKGKGIRLESKGFAMGVRLEHPQKLIDRLQYHSPEGRGKWLPAAEYSFVTQVDGRGVYSFCMCPGGVVVPASSSPGELVVNGMSASARAGAKANSGMVVELHPGDFPEFKEKGEFELLEAQRALEKKFFKESGDTLNAPAQRMKDFVEGKDSKDLPTTSYVPGIHVARLDKLLPETIAVGLQKGFIAFDKKCSGFLTNEAVLIGLESRTSSPVRIPRDSETMMHPDIDGLYPAGEGAGFAGGIVSAAIDGRRCVEAYCRKHNIKKEQTNVDNN